MCIHCHPGSHREHSWRLLEDGVAGEKSYHSNDHQPRGEERGQRGEMFDDDDDDYRLL